MLDSNVSPKLKNTLQSIYQDPEILKLLSKYGKSSKDLDRLTIEEGIRGVDFSDAGDAAYFKGDAKIIFDESFIECATSQQLHDLLYHELVHFIRDLGGKGYDAKDSATLQDPEEMAAVFEDIKVRRSRGYTEEQIAEYLQKRYENESVESQQLKDIQEQSKTASLRFSSLAPNEVSNVQEVLTLPEESGMSESPPQVPRPAPPIHKVPESLSDPTILSISLIFAYKFLDEDSPESIVLARDNAIEFLKRLQFAFDRLLPYVFPNHASELKKFRESFDEILKLIPEADDLYIVLESFRHNLISWLLRYKYLDLHLGFLSQQLRKLTNFNKRANLLYSVEQLPSMPKELDGPEGDLYFGIKEDNKIVSMTAITDLGDFYYLEWIKTMPKAEGKGYASGIIEYLKTLGKPILSEPTSPRSIKIFEYLGFKPWGHKKIPESLTRQISPETSVWFPESKKTSAIRVISDSDLKISMPADVASKLWRRGTNPSKYGNLLRSIIFEEVIPQIANRFKIPESQVKEIISGLTWQILSLPPNILAEYNFVRKIIDVDLGFLDVVDSGDQPKDRLVGTILHELEHHFQNIAGFLSYKTVDERSGKIKWEDLTYEQSAEIASIRRLLDEGKTSEEIFKILHPSDLALYRQLIELAKEIEPASVVGSQKSGGEDYRKYFYIDKTDTPFYDNMIEKPEYFKENKGLIFEIKEMSPEEYINECAKMQESSLERQKSMISEESQLSIKKAIEEGEKLYLPYLDYSNNTQEGRNRVYFAKNVLNLSKVPVLIIKSFLRKKSILPERSINPNAPTCREDVLSPADQRSQKKEMFTRFQNPEYALSLQTLPNRYHHGKCGLPPTSKGLNDLIESLQDFVPEMEEDPFKVEAIQLIASSIAETPISLIIRDSDILEYLNSDESWRERFLKGLTDEELNRLLKDVVGWMFHVGRVKIESFNRETFKINMDSEQLSKIRNMFHLIQGHLKNPYKSTGRLFTYEDLGLKSPDNPFKRLKPLMSLWYQDKDGNKYEPDLTSEMPPDCLAGFVEQHSRIPELTEHILGPDGLDISFHTTMNCIEPIVIHMVQNLKWKMVDAITLAASTCEHCLNVLLEAVTGEKYKEKDIIGTHCELCNLIDPEYDKKYHEKHGDLHDQKSQTFKNSEIQAIREIVIEKVGLLRPKLLQKFGGCLDEMLESYPIYTTNVPGEQGEKFRYPYGLRSLRPEEMSLSDVLKSLEKSKEFPEEKPNPDRTQCP